ncbi:MAG TPA: DUF3300 domain-containing protein [Bryobacteraceae bacterium]|nr:DUF3300 domain-containing protein [Bryobacteraceae bacterium]
MGHLFRSSDVFPSQAKRSIAVACSFLLASGGAFPQQQAAPAATAQAGAATGDTAVKLTADQLDSLVAPIALYPDPLLSQVLVASTYPLEIVQASQWMERNKGKKAEELVEAAKKEDWDPSIQAMVAFPDLVKRLANDIRWTTDLGNAFLVQQSEVMEAAQRMRKKAKDGGKLVSNEQQKITTTTVENKTIIEVQPANPQVVYVPSYNPTYVYGPPIYPYPPIYYPPYAYGTGAMIATSAISFGMGVAVGAMFSGGWGWGCGWGGNTVVINNNYMSRNNFNNINRNNINNINRNNIGNGNRSNWQHDGRHRGGVPYSDRNTANKFGGVSRQDRGTDLGRDRASQNARQQIQREGGNFGRGSGADGGLGASNRAGGDRAGTLGDRGTGGADRIGSRDLGSSGNRGSGGAFSGAGGSGSRSRMEGNRGSSGMSSARHGGFSGGGSRGGGGGMRGGGGRRR